MTGIWKIGRVPCKRMPVSSALFAFALVFALMLGVAVAAEKGLRTGTADKPKTQAPRGTPVQADSLEDLDLAKQEGLLAKG